MLPPGGFEFGPFLLDVRTKRLYNDGRIVEMPVRHLAILLALVSQAGVLISKDALIQIGWGDVSTTDNSLAQAINKIRKALAASNSGPYIETEPGHGYRFRAAVTPTAVRGTDAEIEALLGPQRAVRDGRAALETLRLEGAAAARGNYEHLVLQHGDDPRTHVGLANAYLSRFEATRMDPEPDTAALACAAAHAREGVRLNLQYPDAWAVLGDVLARTGDPANALAAFSRAMVLEPHEWMHPLRLGWASWGRDRLRAAARVLELVPHHPGAHWLLATVFVARNALAEARRELDAAVAGLPAALAAGGPDPFPTIGVYSLRGFLLMELAARGAGERTVIVGEALAAFERELAACATGHIYARETKANAWYGIGSCRLKYGDRDAAGPAFREALCQVPAHPMATAGLAILDSAYRPALAALPDSVDGSAARAALLVSDDDVPGAVRLVADALATAPPGRVGWTIPIDPLLGVHRHPDLWAGVLAQLRARAA